VTIGSDGALYGTTTSGGASQFGTVFKFAKGKLSRLRSFSLSGEVGGRPYGGVVLDTAGNLYGTNYVGGAKNKGTVFQLTPSGGLKEVAPFTGTNGAYPFAGVTLDGAGNVYGTTCNGGTRNKGTVFKWVPGGKLTVLHSFTGTDGDCPYGGVTFRNGVLYGTTYKGGKNDNGTVFKIAASGGPLNILYRFGGDRDGGNPRGDVILNAAGTTLYGTTQFGGRTDGKFYNLGTVYQLTLP
ncbi:MAG TPA: choice-of-anchor tandem repeat GloVer-containing protein, partial [Stenomitos sp.]